MLENVQCFVTSRSRVITKGIFFKNIFSPRLSIMFIDVLYSTFYKFVKYIFFTIHLFQEDQKAEPDLVQPGELDFEFITQIHRVSKVRYRDFSHAHVGVSVMQLQAFQLCIYRGFSGVDNIGVSVVQIQCFLDTTSLNTAFFL